MAPAQVVCLLLFVLLLHIGAEPVSSHFIRPGSSLYANSTNTSWLSPSGRFAFGFYPHGNGFAVGIWLISKSNSTVVWTANRDDVPVSLNSSIEFTKDDKLLLRTGQGKENRHLVELNGDNDKPAVAASMEDSGNFRIYGDDTSDVIWQSFENPTDTLLGGQIQIIYYDYIFLTSSKSTFDHSRGRFNLLFSSNPGLAAYAVNHSRVSWDFYGTIPLDQYYSELYLSPRGVLKLRLRDDNKTIQIIARSSYNPANNETVIYRATLDADGIFRLYSHRFNNINGDSHVSTEWSALQNPCEVKGICGFNSFCSTNNSKAECHCFPGFDFINPHKKSRGCYKTFNDREGCKTKEPAVFYDITVLENTKLGGVPYAKLSVKKEDCRKSCLTDCYCGAAFFWNRTCYNFRLPLMFGMKDQNESSTVFVKSSGNTQRISSPRNKPQNLKDRNLAQSKKNLIRVLGASLGSITFLCFLIAISSFLVYRHRVDRYTKLHENPNLGIMQEFTLRSFNYNELEQATNGFKEELGRGEFGAVYKGFMNEGNKNIAVKRLENPVEGGERKFRAEMAAISRTHHRNLVRLLGFCMEGSEKLLVYEYMSNGSLADLLFKRERRPPWTERVKIALDVARGILYLHEECEVQIIHCNIKSRNIFLDDYWTAKISNFGFAKLLMPNQTETQADARGGKVCMAPEWQKNALITVNLDVHSFGIVLLEIVCCRRNLDVHVSTADEMLLSAWVYDCFVARELNKLVIGEEEVDMKTLERMVKVGLLCIQDDPHLRPSMKNVILMLEGTMNIPVPPNPSPSLVT